MGTAERAHLDHDHKTHVIRGLLCGSCNLGLGRFKDNPTALRKATDYLDRADHSNKSAAKYGAEADSRPWPTFSPARADHSSAAVHMTGLGPPEDWTPQALRRRALASVQP